jgi:glycolate oxidase FAD binding subunit
VSAPVSDADIVARFTDLLGADAVVTGDTARAYAVDDRTPRCVVFPATVDELSRCAAAADQAGLAIIPVGNGTQLGIGRPPRQYDVALSTQRLRRVVAHEAADMTVTVQAGVTLVALNEVLATAAQRLPLDPPHPERTTIGALIATDASGPLRLSQGKVRDLLIGITVVLADGTVIKGGGRVVKNVAGYDLMKLFTGSFGTLGIIVEATFKVRPCPEHEAMFLLPAASTSAALEMATQVLVAPLAPLYVEVLNRSGAASVGMDGPLVVVGCGGLAEEIAVQGERLEAHFGKQVVRACEAEDGRRLRTALRDFPADAGSPTGCKVSVLPSKLSDVLPRVEDEAARGGLDAAVLAHAGNGISWLRFDSAAAINGAFPSFAEWLRTTVRAADGWVVFDALPLQLKERIDPWGQDAPGATLMRGIKNTLDPRGRLSPGRFVGGI